VDSGEAYPLPLTKNYSHHGQSAKRHISSKLNEKLTNKENSRLEQDRVPTPIRTDELALFYNRETLE
jgi:hypothetical protein